MAKTSSKSNAHSSAPRKDEVRKGASKPPVDLVESIASNAGRLSELKTSQRKERRRALSLAVELGLKLREAAKSDWTKFIELNFWDRNPKARPKKHEQDDAVRFVVRLEYDDDKRAAKIASDVNKAVQYLLGEGRTSAQILGEIVDGQSIRKLCERAGPKTATQTGTKPSSNRLNQARMPAAETPTSKSAKAKTGVKSKVGTPPRPDPAKRPTTPKAGLTKATGKPTTPQKIGTAPKPSKKASSKEVRLPAMLVFPQGYGEFFSLPKGTEVKARIIVGDLNSGYHVMKWSKA